MADETNRPGGPERNLPAPRPEGESFPARPVERFTAPRQTRAIGGLTEQEGQDTGARQHERERILDLAPGDDEQAVLLHARQYVLAVA